MKRITRSIKVTDLMATLINLLYIILAVAVLIFFFSIMSVPTRPEWVNDPVNYVYSIQWGLIKFTMDQLTMNIVISLLVGFLIVSTPMTFKSFQRYFDKKTIEVDEWYYRHQYLLSAFELLTLNPFSAAIRIYLGRNVQIYVAGYGVKQGLVNSGKTIKKGSISAYHGIKKFFIKLAKFIYRIARAVIRFTIQLYYIILQGLKSLWTHLKDFGLWVRYLFVSKESDKYKEYVNKKISNKEKLATIAKERKELRIDYKLQKLEEKESRKNKETTQEDLDEVTRKDVVMSVLRLVLTYGTLTITALFIFIPFYWMIITALKTYNETTSNAPSFFIGLSQMQWVNFKIALTEFNFLQYIGNTVFVGVTTMFFTVLTTILAAFAFARLDFKGKEFIFSLLLMTMMIPGELYTITNYITVSRLNWINTHYALIVPFSASVFYIFFLRQTFRQIPDTLYRAARVDGCSDFKYLTRVMIPIAAPTIITIVILSSIGAWDAYIWPQLVGKTDATTLVSVALRNENFSVGSGSDARPMYNLQLAATSVVTVPLLIVFFSLKKYILAGVGRSGTKG